MGLYFDESRLYADEIHITIEISLPIYFVTWKTQIVVQLLSKMEMKLSQASIFIIEHYFVATSLRKAIQALINPM